MPETSSPPQSRSTRSKHKVLNIERKRQTDRESQRVVRERTKKYISYLENLVDTLQKGQQDERLQSMALHCKELHDENERLRSSITSITRIVRGVEMPDGSESNSTRPAGESMDAQKHRAGSFTSMNGSPPNAPSQKEQQQPHSPMSMDTQIPTAAPGPTSNGLKVPSPIAPSEHFSTDVQLVHALGGSPANGIAAKSPLSAYGDETTVFVMINNLLTKAESIKTMIMKPEEDADIAIRAVAHGWPLAEQRYELDAGWEVIRQIDQGIFFCCGPVERLAILRVTRLKLIQQMTVSNQQEIEALLPTYMQARPLQEFVDHPKVIDYFVWPELREFLILNPNKREASNHIAAAFASSLRYMWPFDLSDVWTRNRQTSLYSFSKLFDESFHDIRSWGLSREFFEAYPDLHGFVPCYEHMPDVPAT